MGFCSKGAAAVAVSQQWCASVFQEHFL